jgi:hypothetical protein
MQKAIKSARREEPTTLGFFIGLRGSASRIGRAKPMAFCPSRIWMARRRLPGVSWKELAEAGTRFKAIGTARNDGLRCALPILAAYRGCLLLSFSCVGVSILVDYTFQNEQSIAESATSSGLATSGPNWPRSSASRNIRRYYKVLVNQGRCFDRSIPDRDRTSRPIEGQFEQFDPKNCCYRDPPIS